jgi:3-hydroxyisobutyrate dehydrogenase-like beta-hydroxyacid dehydrogenase
MNIALLGYGEVGRILAEDLRSTAGTLTAFDPAAESDRAMRAHAESQGVALARSHRDAIQSAELVISAVTASQTIAAAQECAGALPAGALFLDLNSASPGTKIVAAMRVTTEGGRYVEGAVMASMPPYRIRVPLLLGGPHAAVVAPMLRDLGFAPMVASDELGVASATKMCRSVVIKGLEAIMVESLTTARHYGVEGPVLASLEETFPGIDWEKQAAHLFQRVIEHGRRRSEEMREAAVTVRDAGLVPWSAASAAERQAWVADLADRGTFGDRTRADFARTPDFRTEADRILAAITRPAET